MILDPIQPVMCDNCQAEEEFSMTRLANGSFDDSNIESDLIRRAQWTVVGCNHYCSQECHDEAKDE